MFALEVINAINTKDAPERPIRRRWKGDTERPWPSTQTIQDSNGRLIGVIDLGTVSFDKRDKR